jgi:hypothetical protein
MRTIKKDATTDRADQEVRGSVPAHIGLGLFGIGVFAAIAGWLPVLTWVSVDAPAGTAAAGVDAISSDF